MAGAGMALDPTSFDPLPDPQSTLVDPLSYSPYLFELILDVMPREDLLDPRNVCKGWRAQVEKRLYRHIVLDMRRVTFHTANGRSRDVDWHGDSLNTRTKQHAFNQMRRYCKVIDYKGTKSLDEAINPLRVLPRVSMVRRFAAHWFSAPAETVVDFAAWFRSGYRASFRVNRFVVPHIVLEVPPDMAPNKIPGGPKITHWAGAQQLFALDLNGLIGVREVVLLFVEGMTSLSCAMRAFTDGLKAGWKQSRFEVMFVGLKSSHIDLEDELEAYLRPFKSPEAARRSISFCTHAEYRDFVGEEQYALETDPLASAW